MSGEVRNKAETAYHTPHPPLRGPPSPQGEGWGACFSSVQKRTTQKQKPIFVGNRPACSVFTGTSVSHRKAEWAGPFPTMYSEIFTIDRRRIKPQVCHSEASAYTGRGNLRTSLPPAPQCPRRTAPPSFPSRGSLGLHHTKSHTKSSPLCRTDHRARSCQKATAEAAATLRESTSWDMGIRTV